MVPCCKEYQSRRLKIIFMPISNISLEKVSLIISVAGIVAVFLIATGTEPRNIEISDISPNLIGYQVSVEGYVTDFYWHDGHFFATLSKNRETIKLVIFERNAKNFPALQNVTKNSHLIAVGTINEYERELEIIAKDVKILA
jgi:hypothetical protein